MLCWCCCCSADIVDGGRAVDVMCVFVSSVGVFGGVNMGETRAAVVPTLRSSRSKDMPGKETGL